MKTCILILPNQLFKNHPNTDDTKNMIIYNHPEFFTNHSFHKYKLTFHLATIYAYIDEMKSKYNITHLYEDQNLNILKSYDKVYIYDPTDYEIEKEITKFCTKNKIELVILETQLFIFTKPELEEYIKSTSKPYFNATFYKWARHKKNILMTKDNKPIGGKYSYDIENRLKFPDNYKEDKVKLITNKYIEKAKSYVEKYYKDNLGEINSYLPITRKASISYFKKFLTNRLKNFGPYEDAFDEDVIVGFHSCCSALINIGLLNPTDIIDITLNYYSKHKNTKIESVEAYIRQVISWREFVRLLYIKEHSKFMSMNFFKHNNKINKLWYSGDTGIVPVDDAIKCALKYSYLHHIPRLMIMCNIFLLTEMKPLQVYEWFMSVVSIDAYKWVMLPNVMGMGLHSVGTLMMTRPYFSSSNYIFKMSHYKKDKTIELDKEKYNWSDVWDGLYYNFVDNNQNYLKKIYATANAVSIIKRMNKTDFNNKVHLAKKYMNEYL